MSFNTHKSKYQNIAAFALLFASGLLFYCYEFYLRLLTGAYEKQIVHHFDITTHLSFSFLISSYSIMYLVMQIPAGILLDRFGSRKILAAATLVCGLGNIIFTLDNYTLALFGRLLVGLGSSFAFVGVLKISREYLPSQYFALFASIVISIGTLAAAFSQQISVLLLSHHISWIALFIYSGLASIPLALLFYLVLHRPPNISHIHIMPNFKDISLNIKKLANYKPLWINGIWGGLIYIPTVVLTSQYGVAYFHSLYQETAYVSTEEITLILLGWVICSPIFSFLADVTHKAKSVVVISGILLILTLLAITFMPGSIENRHLIFMMAFLLGSFSSCQVIVWHVFNKICPKHLSAIGIAFTNMIITGVTEIGQLSSGLMLDWHRGLKEFSLLTGFNYPMQFDAVLFIISVSISTIIFAIFYQRYFLTTQNDKF